MPERQEHELHRINLILPETMNEIVALAPENVDIKRKDKIKKWVEKSFKNLGRLKLTLGGEMDAERFFSMNSAEDVPPSRIYLCVYSKDKIKLSSFYADLGNISFKPSQSKKGKIPIYGKWIRNSKVDITLRNHGGYHKGIEVSRIRKILHRLRNHKRQPSVTLKAVSSTKYVPIKYNLMNYYKPRVCNQNDIKRTAFIKGNEKNPNKSILWKQCEGNKTLHMISSKKISFYQENVKNQRILSHGINEDKEQKADSKTITSSLTPPNEVTRQIGSSSYQSKEEPRKKRKEKILPKEEIRTKHFRDKKKSYECVSRSGVMDNVGATKLSVDKAEIIKNICLEVKKELKDFLSSNHELINLIQENCESERNIKSKRLKSKNGHTEKSSVKQMHSFTCQAQLSFEKTMSKNSVSVQTDESDIKCKQMYNDEEKVCQMCSSTSYSETRSKFQIKNDTKIKKSYSLFTMRDSKYCRRHNIILSRTGKKQLNDCLPFDDFKSIKRYEKDVYYQNIYVAEEASDSDKGRGDQNSADSSCFDCCSKDDKNYFICQSLDVNDYKNPESYIDRCVKHNHCLGFMSNETSNYNEQPMEYKVFNNEITCSQNVSSYKEDNCTNTDDNKTIDDTSLTRPALQINKSLCFIKSCMKINNNNKKKSVVWAANLNYDRESERQENNDKKIMEVGPTINISRTNQDKCNFKLMDVNTSTDDFMQKLIRDETIYLKKQEESDKIDKTVQKISFQKKAVKSETNTRIPVKVETLSTYVNDKIDLGQRVIKRLPNQFKRNASIDNSINKADEDINQVDIYNEHSFKSVVREDSETHMTKVLNETDLRNDNSLNVTEIEMKNKNCYDKSLGECIHPIQLNEEKVVGKSVNNETAEITNDDKDFKIKTAGPYLTKSRCRIQEKRDRMKEENEIKTEPILETIHKTFVYKRMALRKQSFTTKALSVIEPKCVCPPKNNPDISREFKDRSFGRRISQEFDSIKENGKFELTDSSPSTNSSKGVVIATSKTLNIKRTFVRKNKNVL